MQSALTNAHKYDAIRRQVVTDHLTGLYNRRYFMNRAGEEIERSLRHQEPLSVLMLDIDNFKQFNDTYGHATGDRVLQTVARAMKDVLRTSDICSRHGGEEFAVLLPSTPGDKAYFVAERVRRTLGGTRYTGLGLPPEVNITLSVGVATCPRDATVLDELMELSDKALYQAKDARPRHGGAVGGRGARAGQELTRAAAGRGPSPMPQAIDRRRQRTPREQLVVERAQRAVPGRAPRVGQAQHLALAQQVAHRLPRLFRVPAALELRLTPVHPRLAHQELHGLARGPCAPGAAPRR